MFDVVLFQPEIPPNTGNIIRLCANTGVRLHLIEPLGFEFDDRRLRRAGLDYAEYADVRRHTSLESYLTEAGSRRLWACSTRGELCYARVAFAADDALLFGSESSGLPESVRAHPRIAGSLFIPMRAGSRSLNLANAVAVVVFEAWRQSGYAGQADSRC